jgi:hypothetical protein
VRIWKPLVAQTFELHIPGLEHKAQVGDARRKCGAGPMT